MSQSSASLSLNESPARMGIDAIELGQRWARVMPEAEARYGVAPTCEARKIARGNSRRAWLLETCSYLPNDATLAGAPVQLVRHYYIDQELLRIDIGMAGGDAELAAVAGLMDETFGAGEVTSETGAPVTQWRQAMDEAAVRMAEQSLTGNDAPASAGGKQLAGKVQDAPATQSAAVAATGGSDAATGTGGEAPLVMLYFRDVKAAEEARAIAGW